MENQQQTDGESKVRGRTVVARHDDHERLAQNQNDGAHLLGNLEQLSVLLVFEPDLQQLGALQELEDHRRRDDGRDTQLQQRTTVGGQHGTQPVQRVRGFTGHDPVQRDLAQD